MKEIELMEKLDNKYNMNNMNNMLSLDEYLCEYYNVLSNNLHRNEYLIPNSFLLI